MKVPLETPIRFLAMRWHEDWEFDYPTILLEPAIRYTEHYTGPEGLIEDVAIDMSIDEEYPKDEDVSREFEWRGWSIKNLRRVAAACLKGKKFPKKHYCVTEQWVKFFLNSDNEYELEYVEAPSEK